MGHLHNGILLSGKKEENFTLCNSMDGPREHYAKWNKPIRERHTIWFHSYVESNEQTELTSKSETDSYLESRWQLVGRWGRLQGRGIEQKRKRTHGHGKQGGD